MTRASGPTREDPRDGPLGQVTGAVYRYLVVTGCLAAVTLPSLAALMLLDRSAGNAPLYALFLLPVWPALSAAMFALAAEDSATAPARSFGRGYRLNVADVLRFTVPANAVLAVLALTLANLGEAAVPRGYGGVLVVIGILVSLWAVNAVVIVSFYSFRSRDTARLAAHYLGRLPLVTLGVASLLILAAGIVLVTFDAVLVVVGGLWTGALLATVRPLINDVRRRFVASE